METKLTKLRQYMAAGDHRAALRLAARWQQLGSQRDAITKAWAALQHPQFYNAIGQDPAAIVQTGLTAIRERYQIQETTA